MRPRLFVAALVVPLALLGAAPAVADPAQPTVVSTNPVDFTPHVTGGTVWSIVVVGQTVIVGGSFTQVTNSARTQTYARRNIFAYGLNDGAVRPFAPTVDGAVYALAPGAGNSVYLGGSFKTLNGAAQRGMGRVSLATSQRVKSRLAWNSTALPSWLSHRSRQ